MLSTVLVCTKNVYSEYVNLQLNFIVLKVQYFLPISDPTTAQNQATGTSPPSLRERIAILYRNEHDMATVKEVFGDGLTGMNIVTSKDPHAFNEFLLSLDFLLRSCFIVVKSNNMKEKLLTKSNSTVYQDLLKIAIWKVGKNIFVSSFFSLCSMRLQVRRAWVQERKRCARATREEERSVAPSHAPVHPNTSKRLLRWLVMFFLHTSWFYLVNLVSVFWSRVKLLGHACK